MTRQQRLDLVGLQIEDFPLELKQKMIARSEQQGTNMNDVAVEVLARRFDVDFTPSDRVPPIPASEATSVVFRMPRSLRRKIKNEAVNRDLSARDITIAVLRRSFR